MGCEHDGMPGRLCSICQEMDHIREWSIIRAALAASEARVKKLEEALEEIRLGQHCPLHDIGWGTECLCLTPQEAFLSPDVLRSELSRLAKIPKAKLAGVTIETLWALIKAWEGKKR